MAMRRYRTRGTCARAFDIEIEDGVVKSCSVHGGCRGQGALLSRLATGLDAATAVRMMRGVTCRNGTSCADQLARAIALETGAVD